MSLREGLRRTVAFYRQHMDHYVDAPLPAAGVAAMIPFLTLTLGEDADAVRAAIARVLTRGWFVLGPELEAFETEFAAACGAAHAVGVGTGTDALAIALRALGIGPGDEVITVAAVGGLLRAGDHDGGRAAGVRRHRSRSADARSARGGRRDDAAHRRDHAGPSLRAAGRHAGHRRGRRAARPGDRRGLLPGASRDLRRPAGRQLRRGRGLQLLPDEEPWRARRRRRDDDRRRRRSPPGADGCATAARPTATITPSSA